MFKRINIGLLFIVLLFLIVSLTLGHYKLYLYEDEILSYTAANSLDGLRPKFERYSLTDGKEFVRNALAVDSGHRFDYGNVAENTSDDPHPPLFLFLLHTISSLMPGIYSKWIVLGINIASGMIILILTYKSALKLFGRREDAYAAAALLACSMGFLDKIIFLRMYPMLTVFTSMLFYQYLSFLDSKNAGTVFKTRLHKWGLLLVNIVAGTLTHYYFLIFAFFAAAFYSIWLLVKKDIRLFFEHMAVYAAAAGLSLAIFPSMIWQISSSDPMSESSEGAGGVMVIAGRIRKMFIEFNLDFFNGYLKYFVIAAVFLLAYLIIYEKLRPEYVVSKGHALTLLISLSYFALVAATTPYVSARYLTPVYPLVSILLIFLLMPIIERIFKDRRIGMLLTLLIFILPLYLRVSSGLADRNKAEMLRLAGEYSGDYCITWSGMTLEENYFELEKYAGLYKMKLNDENAPDMIDERIANADELVVYVPEGKDPQIYLDYLKKYVKGLDSYSLLYNAYYADAYLMKR